MDIIKQEWLYNKIINNKKKEENEMKHKALLFGTLGLLSISLVGCGQEAKEEKQEHQTEQKEEKKEKTLDVTKYAETPQNLQKSFAKQFKGYELTEVSIDVKHNDVVYQLDGVNQKENMEASLEVKANKTSEVTQSESETMDNHDKKDNQPLNLKEVKITPKKAMETAKKEASLKSNPNEWQLERNRDNQVVYKISFEKDNKEVTIDAKTGEKLSEKWD